MTELGVLMICNYMDESTNFGKYVPALSHCVWLPSNTRIGVKCWDRIAYVTVNKFLFG